MMGYCSMAEPQAPCRTTVRPEVTSAFTLRSTVLNMKCSVHASIKREGMGMVCCTHGCTPNGHTPWGGTSTSDSSSLSSFASLSPRSSATMESYSCLVRMIINWCAATPTPLPVAPMHTAGIKPSLQAAIGSHSMRHPHGNMIMGTGTHVGRSVKATPRSTPFSANAKVWLTLDPDTNACTQHVSRSASTATLVCQHLQIKVTPQHIAGLKPVRIRLKGRGASALLA